MQIRGDLAPDGSMLVILNQLYLLEQKIKKISEPNSIGRNISRILEEFANLGYFIENPLGEKFDETRTDCEASIAGDSTENLVITEVIKPIIRQRINNTSRIVQRGVVIVEGK
jgi:hypothetical protein